jgi:hypothetical protein
LLPSGYRPFGARRGDRPNVVDGCDIGAIERDHDIIQDGFGN